MLLYWLSIISFLLSKEDPRLFGLGEIDRLQCKVSVNTCSYQLLSRPKLSMGDSCVVPRLDMLKPC